MQPTVINHINGELKTEKRNQMEESSRITRGKISPLSSADASKLDALIIPGGFGAAKIYVISQLKEASVKLIKNY